MASLEKMLDPACLGLGGKESMSSLLQARMCTGFSDTSTTEWQENETGVKASVLSFREILFYIHFCSLAPGSGFCKDWVFPKCFRQTGRATIQAAKM